MIKKKYIGLLILFVSLYGFADEYRMGDIFTKEHLNMPKAKRQEYVKILFKKYPKHSNEIAVLLYDSPNKLFAVVKETVESKTITPNEGVGILTSSVYMNHNRVVIAKENMEYLHKIIKDLFLSEKLDDNRDAMRAVRDLKLKEFTPMVTEVCLNKKYDIDERLGLNRYYVKKFDLKLYERIKDILMKELHAKMVKRFGEDSYSKYSILTPLINDFSSNEKKRLKRIVLIQKITKQNLGYNPLDSKEKRVKVVRKWEKYFDTHPSELKKVGKEITSFSF